MKPKKRPQKASSEKGSSFEYFDDCPICQAMKRADETGKNLTYPELRETFDKAGKNGAIVGGQLPDDPDVSLQDFLHVIGGPNDPCPCGSGKKYKKCHGK